jgi:hypothetical protein
VNANCVKHESQHTYHDWQAVELLVIWLGLGDETVIKPMAQQARAQGWRESASPSCCPSSTRPSSMWQAS